VEISNELFLIRAPCKISDRPRSKDEVRMTRRFIVCSLSLLFCLILVTAPKSAAVAIPPQSAGVQITGTVVDGSLSPLSGAIITLSRQNTVVARTTSNAEGRFRFERVSPGDYEVKVVLEGELQHQQTVRVMGRNRGWRIDLTNITPTTAPATDSAS